VQNKELPESVNPFPPIQSSLAGSCASFPPDSVGIDVHPGWLCVAPNKSTKKILSYDEDAASNAE
jgi:hypothetical protein